MRLGVLTDRFAHRARRLRSRGALRARRKPVSVTRAVVQFGLASLVAVLVIGFAGVEVLKGEGDREAFKDAKELTTLAGRGIVQPMVTDGLLTGDPVERGRVDRVVRTSVLGHGIVRVKIWTEQGRIAYSDAAALIGSVYPLPADELSSLRSGDVVAEPNTDTALPENRFERSVGPLVDIYLPIHTPGGRPLLFEAYLPAHEVSASARRRWEAFAPALFGGLVLLALVQLPLAWSLASRLRRGQQEREALLTRAIEASEDERRRIAGDLHDGVVQDLAGVAYSLAATAGTVGVQPPEALAESLRSSASQTRQSIRSLRSLLVDIYPANLRTVGLEAALSDLVSSLSGRGIDARLDYPRELELGEEVESLLYRVAQEALRNVAAHARAEHVEVSVSTSGPTVSLTVRDDGVGFSAGVAIERASAGHLGLSLLAELVREHGGQFEIESEPGKGTRVRVEVERL
jgi:two-component system NarL family sensor kinase